MSHNTIPGQFDERQHLVEMLMPACEAGIGHK
jgi:hypothetical protein